MKLLATLLAIALPALATPIGNDGDPPPKWRPNLLQMASFAPLVKVAKVEILPEPVLFRQPGTKRAKVWVGPLTLPPFNVCRGSITQVMPLNFMFRLLDAQYLELWIHMAIH
jgi:hypothetical protein